MTFNNFCIFLLFIIVIGNGVAKEKQEFWEIITEKGECTININHDLPEPQPLLIIPNTNKFLYPNRQNGIIHLLSGQSVELFCTKSFKENFHTTNIIATCTKDGQFNVNEKNYNFNEFACISYPFHVVRKNGELCNQGKANQYEIGFNVDKRFLKLMDLCHDEQLESTLYSHYYQTEMNRNFQLHVTRPNFITGGLYHGKKIDKFYKKKNQIEILTKILQSEKLANNLIHNKGDSFLSRGHLAAKADYIFGAQQRATFYFINVAPQWQKFNAGNWEKIENGLRMFVTKHNKKIEIYTGTFGIMTTPDINNNSREIFLDFDVNNNGQIPVPKLYYKIAIETLTRLGIVLIGVNNPHTNLDEIKNNYIICNDLSDKIKWLTWDRTNIAKGYSYACDVNDFMRAVEHLPSLNVTGLLL